MPHRPTKSNALTRPRALSLPALSLLSPLLLALVALCAAPAAAAPSGASVRRRRVPARYFVMGDGTLSIRSTKNRHRFSGRYRRSDGRYIRKALERINRVIGTRYSRPAARVSLRFIELLSFLRRRLKGGWITVSSGFRSPAYNRRLRARGRTVAKASLHQYGMASDLRISRVKSKALWLLTKKLRLGGTGYYGSPWVHIDTGPARSWTQGTANVRKGVSNVNKRIIAVPRRDIYRRGETLRLRFVRMTAYPIGVRSFALERADKPAPGGAQKPGTGRSLDARYRKVAAARVELPARARRRRGSRCARFYSIAALTGFRWKIPPTLRPGRYRLRVRFCAVKWAAMPKSIVSYPFVVRKK